MMSGPENVVGDEQSAAAGGSPPSGSTLTPRCLTAREQPARMRRVCDLADQRGHHQFFVENMRLSPAHPKVQTMRTPRHRVILSGLLVGSKLSD